MITLSVTELQRPRFVLCSLLHPSIPSFRAIFCCVSNVPRLFWICFKTLTRSVIQTHRLTYRDLVTKHWQTSLLYTFRFSELPLIVTFFRIGPWGDFDLDFTTIGRKLSFFCNLECALLNCRASGVLGANYAFGDVSNQLAGIKTTVSKGF